MMKLKRKRFRCTTTVAAHTHTHRRSGYRNTQISTKIIIIINLQRERESERASKQCGCCHWIQSLLATTYSSFIWIFIFAFMRAADHQTLDQPELNRALVFDQRVQSENQFCGAIEARATFLNPLLWPRATCTSTILWRQMKGVFRCAVAGTGASLAAK